MIKVGDTVKVMSFDPKFKGRVGTIKQCFSAGGLKLYLLDGTSNLFTEGELEVINNVDFISVSENAAMIEVNGIILAVAIDKQNKSEAVDKLIAAAKRLVA